MVDLTDMEFAAKRTQAALAEQPGEVPALIFEALVLDAEQPGQRQRLQGEFAHSAPRYRFS